MKAKRISLFSILTVAILVVVSPAFSQQKEIKLGFIGSLTSFAASYGTAALEGAQLAAKELNENGAKIQIIVEDDQSIAKNTVSAFVKLAKSDNVQGIIGGSWWINAIVQQAERENLPLVSCETLYNQETVLGKSSFILQGDLREWIQIYEPLIANKDYKRGAIVRYVSGFGATLADEMKNVFSRSGRNFVGAIEYNDIQILEAPSIVLQLKKMKADVVYVDAQPGGLANLLKRMAENGMENVTVFTNTIAEDVLNDKLFDTAKLKNIYYTRRTTFDQDFADKFEKLYGKKPYLNADLGYYAVHLLSEALATKDHVAAIKSGLSVKDRRFVFDEKNVSSGIPQEVWKIEDGKGVKVELE